jgi:hypothetical protein
VHRAIDRDDPLVRVKAAQHLALRGNEHVAHPFPARQGDMDQRGIAFAFGQAIE